MAHIRTCRHCRDLFQVDERLEAELKAAFKPENPSQKLFEQIDMRIDDAPAPLPDPASRRWRIRLAGIAAGILLLLGTGFHVLYDPAPAFTSLNQLSLQAVGDHLKGNRQIQFEMADFPLHLDRLKKELGFNVILPDLEGFIILGGRLCGLGRCKAAYFVFERDGRTGSLFIMDYDLLNFRMADGSRFFDRIKGCDTHIWKDNGQVYAMVF